MDCAGSGQDGTIRAGRAWPEPHFSHGKAGVIDCLSGLCRHHGAKVVNGEVRRQQALAGIEILNAADSQAGWRLPNVNELESLVDCSRARPALALAMHSYDLPDAVYWSSTTAGTDRTGHGPCC